MGFEPVLVTVVGWGGLVTPTVWPVNVRGGAERAGVSWPCRMNRDVCTQSVAAAMPAGQAVAASAGFGLMPGPWIRKKLRLDKLPMTRWGVAPSEMNPVGGAGAPDHCRNGSIPEAGGGVALASKS